MLQSFIRLVIKSHKLMSGDVLNRREIYKKQKLQQIDQIYYCQCGKNYLTFSALYLHARNKHNVKLTTKRTPQICKIEPLGDKTIVTYFILPPTNTQSSQHNIQNYSQLQKQNSDDKNSIFINHIKIINQYLNQNQTSLTLAHLQVFDHFKNYLTELHALFQTQNIEEIRDITLLFNQFSYYYFPKCYQKQLTSLDSFIQSQNFLIELWAWLKSKQYTSYELLHKVTPFKK